MSQQFDKQQVKIRPSSLTFTTQKYCSGHLTVFHQNVDRISNKIDRLSHLIQIIKPHVVVLTEHGLTQDHIINTRLEDYCLAAEYSRQNHLKGGVAIYCQESIIDQVEPVEVQNISIELVCEIAMVKIKTPKQHIHIIGIYRPPQGSLTESMDVIASVLDKVPTWKSPIIMVGDINIDCLKPDRDQVSFSETLLSYNMTRIPLPPTRITPQSQTSIDCVCTNQKEDEVSVQILSSGISDHMAQLCMIQILPEKTTNIRGQKRNFSDDNIHSLKHLLTCETWDSVFNSDNVETAYDNFSNIIASALNQTCPYKKYNQRRSKRKIWNPELNTLRREFLDANERYLMTGSLEHKQEAAAKKKNYDLKIKELRRQSTANQIAQSENKTKAIWDIINNERRTKKSLTGPKELKIDNKTSDDPLQIVDHFNTVFTTMADSAILSNNPLQNPNNLQATVLQQLYIPPFHLQETTIEEVIKTINSLPAKVSAGVDEVSPKLLKACKYEIAIPLTTIINMSFQSGKFPSHLKLSKVIPIFKQGDQCEATNYRPISLVSTFSKVIEKIVLTRLLNYLTHHNLLTEQQHGFTKNRSTTTALISFIEHIIDQVEAKNTTTAILLDFSKAFDTLEHEQLLTKLNTMGVRGTEAEWFRSYLTNREQVVEIRQTQNNKIVQVTSNPLTVLRGVPQGSVLGPVLFTLFTNDLPKYLDEFATTLMYADDTVLLLSDKSTENLEIKSFTAMNMAVQYCHQNDLVVNEAKTQQLVFATRKEQSVHLPNVHAAAEAKYLGVTIDEDLKWTSHIDIVCRKLSTSLYTIKRIKSISDIASAKTAYYALFESNLRYGLLVWGSSTTRNLQRILVAQKKAVRALAGLQPRESCRPAFTNLSILTVVSLYVLEAVTLVHESGFPRGCNTHQYNTRRATDFHLPAHRLSLFEKKPSYMSLKLWNCLPEDFKKLNARTFKTKVKLWLLQNPFYTIEEYYRRGGNDN
uniref:Reverse transcriptase domain-containing protein n=1 Tax=Cuerna arida TaxID=1464854 RepID=A0A1B6GU06_9HEMI